MVNPSANRLPMGGVDPGSAREPRIHLRHRPRPGALRRFLCRCKPGKLPWKSTPDLLRTRYGHDTLEIHADAIEPGQRVLLVDDLLATGGTMKACCELAAGMRATIVGITVLIELVSLSGPPRRRAVRPRPQRAAALNAHDRVRR